MPRVHGGSPGDVADGSARWELPVSGSCVQGHRSWRESDPRCVGETCEWGGASPPGAHERCTRLDLRRLVRQVQGEVTADWPLIEAVAVELDQRREPSGDDLHLVPGDAAPRCSPSTFRQVLVIYMRTGVHSIRRFP